MVWIYVQQKGNEKGHMNNNRQERKNRDQAQRGANTRCRPGADGGMANGVPGGNKTTNTRGHDRYDRDNNIHYGGDKSHNQEYRQQQRESDGGSRRVTGKTSDEAQVNTKQSTSQTEANTNNITGKQL